MCGMNLAFNRELIGPAMYFGLMGEGQPLGRYDDMWAGWCCKVCSLTSSYLPNYSQDSASATDTHLEQSYYCGQQHEIQEQIYLSSDQRQKALPFICCLRLASSKSAGILPHLLTCR